MHFHQEHPNKYVKKSLRIFTWRTRVSFVSLYGALDSFFSEIILKILPSDVRDLLI